MAKKVSFLEERVKEEKEKVAREKREMNEQFKLYKTEHRSLSEKLARLIIIALLIITSNNNGLFVGLTLFVV